MTCETFGADGYHAGMNDALETVRVPAGAFRQAMADGVEAFALCAKGAAAASIEEAVGHAIRSAMPTIVAAHLDQLRAEGYTITPPRVKARAIKRLKGGVDDTRQ